jgi:hypothetical protein
MLCAIAFNDIHVTCTIDLSVDGVDPEEVQTLPAFTSPFGNTSDPMAIMTDTLRGVRRLRIITLRVLRIPLQQCIAALHSICGVFLAHDLIYYLSLCVCVCVCVCV